MQSDELEDRLDSLYSRVSPPPGLERRVVAAATQCALTQGQRGLLRNRLVPLAAGFVFVCLLTIGVLLIADRESSRSENGPAGSSSPSAPAWVQNCLPDNLGPVTTQFDGLSVQDALRQAAKAGLVIDFVAADGGCDLGRIPIEAGKTYVAAAVDHGIVVFTQMLNQ